MLVPSVNTPHDPTPKDFFALSIADAKQSLGTIWQASLPLFAEHRPPNVDPAATDDAFKRIWPLAPSSGTSGATPT